MTGNGSVSGPIKAVGFLSSMDVWWAGQDDSVQGGSWSQGQPWQQYELAPPLSINTPSIAAVSRIPTSMEVWWVDRRRHGLNSVQGAYWHEGQPWQLYELAPPGSVAPLGRITAVSRIPNSMEVWWQGPGYSLQGAYWYEGQPWQHYQLAPPGSAYAEDITAISRIPTSMEVWWFGPDKSVQGAYWYEGQPWHRYELAPPGSACSTGIAAVSRIPTSMEVWWTGPNNSVQGAYWNEGQPWQHYQLAPPGSASFAIAALSRKKFVVI
jgi:hypothetical protein